MSLKRWVMGALITGTCWLRPAASAEIDTLYTRICADYLTASTSNAAGYLSSQLADGSWSDVDYADTSRTNWKPGTHLSRLQTMSVAFNKVSDANYHNAAMGTGIKKGLSFWYSRKARSNNWWYNDIGQQLNLGPVLMLMRDSLSSALRDTGCTYLLNPKLTGQNLVWYSSETVLRGCIKKNVNDVILGLDSIKGQAAIFAGEGLQIDYSFFQHMQQLYNQGYGGGFIADETKWAVYSKGLSFSFSPVQLSLLVGLNLDGNRWMTRGQLLDLAGGGRGITRTNSSKSATGLVGGGDKLMAIAPARLAEWNAFKAHIQGTAPDPLSGNKHFWRADFMAHHRAAYYASVKMCSKRTIGTECMNSENLKGYWIPFGFTGIYRNGTEYADIYPTWDWSGLPGITSPAKVPKLPTYQTQQTDFVGGASDSTYGAAALDFSKDSTTAKKSYFFFDNEFVCLGTAIKSTSNSPIYTTLNQCLKNGSMTVNGTSVATGSQNFNGTVQVFHDSVGYVLIDSVAGSVSLASRSGTWYAINTSQSSTTITKDVFTLRIAHGTKPTNSSYAYVVVPGISQTQFTTYAASLPVTVAANRDTVQAVYHPARKVYEAVFYKAGSVSFGSTVTIDVDKPCIVIVRGTAVACTLTVADPTQTLSTITCGTRFGASVRVATSFSLPTGLLAGSSVVKVLVATGLLPKFTFRSAQKSTMVCDIFSLNGKRIGRVNSSDISLLHLGASLNLKSGVYVVKSVGIGGEQVVGRVMVK